MSEAISLSSSLTSLDLTNMNLGDAIISRIAMGLVNHRSVSCVDFSGNGLTRQVLDSLRSSLPPNGIVMVSLASNLFTDSCAAELHLLLMKLKKIRHLDLSNNTFGRNVGRVLLELFSSDLGSELFLNDTQIPGHMISLLTTSNTISDADEYHSDPEPPKLANLTAAVVAEYPLHMTCMHCKSPNHYSVDCLEKHQKSLITQRDNEIIKTKSTKRVSIKIESNRKSSNALADCWEEL